MPVSFEHSFRVSTDVTYVDPVKAPSKTIGGISCNGYYYI